MRLFKLFATSLLALALAGCFTTGNSGGNAGGGDAGMSWQAGAGGVVGAVAGGLLGSQVGSGSGRLWATGVGAVLGAGAGAWAGHELGKPAQLQNGDMPYIIAATKVALDRLGPGGRQGWHNPATGNKGYVQVGALGDCRAYRVVMDGLSSPVVPSGNACRGANGQWSDV